MCLPISVIIPLSKHREKFFYQKCLPSIEQSRVDEIIIVNEKGSAPEKRNKGVVKSTQPYLYFCDDDIVLPNNYLEILYNALKTNTDDNIVYAYTNYNGIVTLPNRHFKKNFKHNARKWNWHTLKQANYISTMSLLKKEFFPGFDKKLQRLQDWELWIHIYKKYGKYGTYVKNIAFDAYYNDLGITSQNVNSYDAIIHIKEKHNL